MLSGAGSQAQGPDPGSPRQDGRSSVLEPAAEAPRKEACGEGLRSRKPSPAPGRNPEGRAAWRGREDTRAPPGRLPAPEPPGTGSSGAARGPLARLGRRREARLPFSRFLDEVTARVLDPGTLEAFRGPRGHSPEPSRGEQGPGPAPEPLKGAAAPEKTLALSPSPASEGAPEAPSRVGPGLAAETSGARAGSGRCGGQAASPWRPPSRGGLAVGATEGCGSNWHCGLEPPAHEEASWRLATCWNPLGASRITVRLRSPWVPSCLGQPRILQGRLARSSPSLWDSALQEQKGELRKRLSYTTHKLEKLETEFDSTRHYLEIELRRAQEELEKVTEKLRRIQSNYLALQRINQELEDKLYRMGQHYEEEKRALSHEIVALNSHLLEAKVTIDKLSEDNALYRKDCNLAAQLLQCSQTYGRGHKVSELPSDFQERVSLHLEEHGCGLPSPLCHPAYADSVPSCVIAKVLEKPDPSSLSSRLSDASARDLAFREGGEKPGPRPPYKGDIYCSDTALYCPEERRRTRRPSGDASVTDVGFLRGQNSTDSAAEEEEEAEAAAFPAGFRHDAFPGYAASLPTSSSYSSFSATSEEKDPEWGRCSSPSVPLPSTTSLYLRCNEALGPPAPVACSPAVCNACPVSSPSPCTESHCILSEAPTGHPPPPTNSSTLPHPQPGPGSAALAGHVPLGHSPLLEPRDADGIPRGSLDSGQWTVGESADFDSVLRAAVLSWTVGRAT
ncbi:brain-enriched guanylate kinase-associated protein [Suricata suricatta]|uniref:brain-enriched guanylate kinase-associated protein n=1 Tax=Suricata suricatta TaxID=37032 RepID=UPI0011552D91|nr:brain-enriched guanylate kinase-associated protein [Suricata suricatta]